MVNGKWQHAPPALPPIVFTQSRMEKLVSTLSVKKKFMTSDLNICRLKFSNPLFSIVIIGG